MNLYLDYGRTFIPFRLRSEAAPQARSSLGGQPPSGVIPNHVEAHTRHLATLGLEDEVDVSLFSTFDYAPQQGPFDFFAGSYQLHGQSTHLIQFVVHPRKSRREIDSPLKSELPALGFVFGEPGTDPECLTLQALGDPAIYVDHKVGGQPSFSQLEAGAASTLELMHQGYAHLLQLESPSNQDTPIEANWPFGESVFHVFAKKSGHTFEFQYIWS